MPDITAGVGGAESVDASGTKFERIRGRDFKGGAMPGAATDMGRGGGGVM